MSQLEYFTHLKKEEITFNNNYSRHTVWVCKVLFNDYQILEILSWFKWNVKQSLNVIPYKNIIFMVIWFFGYLDICLHQCSIMHFFFIYPALFLFLYFLPEKHDIVNDEFEYKPMQRLPINPFSSTSLMKPNIFQYVTFLW